MKKLFVIVTTAIFLAGCVTTGIPKLDNIIDRIQQETAKRCGFVPAISTVGAILEMLGVTGSVVIAATVTTVANKVCAAVTQPVTRRAGGPVTAVKFVPVVCNPERTRCVSVTGYYVR